MEYTAKRVKLTGDQVSASGWTPILQGSTADEASHAIQEIANALDNNDPQLLSAQELYEHALFFSYLSAAQKTSDSPAVDSAAKSLAFLNIASERAADGPHQLALFGGLCGLGWTIEHLMRREVGPRDFGELDDQDPLEDVDAFVLRRLGARRRSGAYDLISGSVGAGVYCLERLPRDAARQGLKSILADLESTAESRWGGCTWRTPPEGLPAYQKEICPYGYYNLGVAHGVPGVIVLLAEIAAAGVESNRANELLTMAIDWLLARRRQPQAMSRFSSWFVPGAEPTDSRLGWCYGDLGIAATLSHVARVAKRPDLAPVSTDLVSRCVRRPLEHAGIDDTGLCHGALGVAHMFSRIFQNTSDPIPYRASLEWYERGLRMRRSGDGIAGFFSWHPDKVPSVVSDRSFLSGAVGCGLALLAGVSGVAPEWDRILLLSGRSWS